jgi:integrase
MAWKATGEPTVRQHRGRCVVRVDGIDTTTGRHRPRQLGTYPSKRAAEAAARTAAAEGRVGPERGTVSWLVRRWVRGRTDISQKGREQYEWALAHIEAGLGAVRIDRLDREDVSAWLDGLAKGGRLSRRSIEVCRTVLKASLTDAVEEGLLRRNPAARVPLPKTVAKPPKVKEAEVWDEAEVARFLTAAAGHRWGAGLRLCVLYGLRRSELLALRFDDIDLVAGTVRFDEGLVDVRTGIAWSEGKTHRARRVLGVDPRTVRALAERRRAQLEERLAAGPLWQDHDLVIATRVGSPVIPRNFDRSLREVVAAAGVLRLSSHGLRHTAATHIVRHADDVGELRAAADLLGHSLDVLLRIYAHTMPQALPTVTAKIAGRADAPTRRRDAGVVLT